jgi:hypothetical protein
MKKYIIKTYPTMLKEYLVEANDPTEALDIFYHDPEGKVKEHGNIKSIDHDTQIMPDVEELDVA